MTILSISCTAWSQETLLTLTGGYAWANFEDTDAKASGWRINGLYEFNPSEGKFSHGFSIGYISTKSDSAGVQGVEYKLNTLPMYYAPKVMFGSGKVKAFVKGALGAHLSYYKRTGGSGGEIKTNDAGFYGGVSVGAMIFVSEKTFLNAEYEWAWMSNTYVRDGFMNSALFGIGMRF